MRLLFRLNGDHRHFCSKTQKIVLKKHIIPLLLLILLTGCAPKENLPAPIATKEIVEENAPSAPTQENYTEIRYALLAPHTEENIWSLFDEKGASYENYATQGINYPRLYQLTPPNNELTPLLADGFPTPFTQEGAYFVSTVTLLPDLKWENNTPLTAEDIAFTINTALEFQLGLNWAKFYNPAKLHHAEALDSQTLKYYFTTSPNVGDWQYGALIGVFTSQSYWQLKIEEAQSLLPPKENNPVIAESQAKLSNLQTEEKNITEAMARLEKDSTKYRQQKLLLDENLNEQNVLLKNIDNAQREERESYIAARLALYALPPSKITLTENYPVYSREEAIKALLNNEIDFILSPQTLTDQEIEQLSNDSTIHFLENRKNDLRFLAFNHRKKLWDDVALRRAISCLIDPKILANEKLEGRVVPALGWVALENIGWHSSIISPPCAGMDADARLSAGMRILQEAGYAWSQEPSPNHAGSGLLLPSGVVFPPVTILAPREDPFRTEAASYIATVAHNLGIPVEINSIPADDLFFKVYGISDYDLAIVGWQLSPYPDYLCGFFAAENAYYYNDPTVNEKCDEFLQISDPALAREKLFEIEILLWDSLPAVPLFSSKITEAYRNFPLPFENYLGGFAPTFYRVPIFLE